MPEATAVQKSVETNRVFEDFRRWGYLAANLDPLGFLTPIRSSRIGRSMERLRASRARKFYCGTIGAEYVHIDDPARRRWIAERMEKLSRRSPIAVLSSNG